MNKQGPVHRSQFAGVPSWGAVSDDSVALATPPKCSQPANHRASFCYSHWGWTVDGVASKTLTRRAAHFRCCLAVFCMVFRPQPFRLKLVRPAPHRAERFAPATLP